MRRERLAVDVLSLPFLPVPHRDGAARLLVVADDEHVGYAVAVGLLDLAADGPRAVLYLDPEVVEFARQAVRVAQVVVADGEDAHLFGRQPERELPVEMFDENHQEPLVTAVEGAMQHDRTVVLVVLAGVGQVEPLGHVEIELNRRAVPLATEGVLEREVDLRPVESAVARLHVVGDVLGVEYVT